MILGAAGDPTLSEAIGKRLMTPGGTVAPGVAPELFPVVVLENDRPEMLFLENSGLYSYYVSSAAGGAGTRSTVQLYNGVENMIAVIEQVDVIVASGTAQLHMRGFSPGVQPFGTAVGGVSSDSRARLGAADSMRRSSSLVITDNTLGTSATSATRQWESIGTLLQFSGPFILGPWSSLYVQPSADNVSIITCAIRWRERRLNQSERI